jgi:hypothetical protein
MPHSPTNDYFVIVRRHCMALKVSRDLAEPFVQEATAWAGC